MPREDTLIVRAGRKFGAPELYNPYLAGHRGETGNWWMAENLFYMNLYQGEIVPVARNLVRVRTQPRLHHHQVT